MDLVIYHTNDVHSNLEKFSKIATIIKAEKSEDALLLDAGDFHDFMRLEMNGTNGACGKHLLEALDYDAVAVGNNEGFAGVYNLKVIAKTGKTPMLSSNLYLIDMNKIEGIKRSEIVIKNGHRILIIGVTPMFNEFFHLEGMHSTEAKEEIEKEIKSNEGKYDLCILLSHLGYSNDCVIAEMDLGINVIIGGHSHTEMDNAIQIKNTIIHQSGKYGEFVGKLILNLNGNSIVSFVGENIKTEPYDEDVKIMQMILEEKKLAIKNLSTPLFIIKDTIWHDVVMENPLTNLVCDALFKYYPCDFALMNSGILSCGIKDEVSKLKLLQISPSPLNPTYVNIKGKNILEALNSTLDEELCLTNGKGAGFRGRYLGRLHVSKNVSITVYADRLDVKINGETLDEDKDYLIMTSDYLQRGTGYPMLFSKDNVEYKQNYIRDVLEKALADDELIEGCFKDRWVKV